jgi:very-short-patch-repair endonuclease
MAGNKGRRSLLENWASLYSNLTAAEQSLEPYIAALGVRYRVQHPFFGLRIFPDFVLPDHALVIEVDDPSHLTAYKKKADKDKTAKLNKLGWTVVRCTNEQALKNPAQTLKQMLKEAGLDNLIKE